jgi:iron-sulfur cluster repair protein YtfE (RIC family)
VRWPDDLLEYHRAHPRASWPALALPELAQRWLAIHDMFRRHADRFEARLGAWRAEVPGFLHHLEMHHHLETVMGFPALTRAAPAVARAFTMLDGDHEAIAELIDRVQRARTAADLEAELPPMLAALRQHLLDEEDIIVPALIVRGHLVRGL